MFPLMGTPDLLLSETFGYVFARILYQPHSRINQRHTFARRMHQHRIQINFCNIWHGSASARELRLAQC